MRRILATGIYFALILSYVLYIRALICVLARFLLEVNVGISLLDATKPITNIIKYLRVPKSGYYIPLRMNILQYSITNINTTIFDNSHTYCYNTCSKTIYNTIANISKFNQINAILNKETGKLEEYR